MPTDTFWYGAAHISKIIFQEENEYHKCPKISNTNVSDKMAYANSADPDQTAPKEQSDQGLHCLPFHKLF